MTTAKISECIVHGLKPPKSCLPKKTVISPDKFYNRSNSEEDMTCGNRYTNLPPPPIPDYLRANICKRGINRCPTLCVCPVKPPVLTLKQKIYHISWTLVKLGFFTGVVKLTHDLGIWSTGDELETVILNIRDVLTPTDSTSEVTVRETEVSFTTNIMEVTM